MRTLSLLAALTLCAAAVATVNGCASEDPGAELNPQPLPPDPKDPGRNGDQGGGTGTGEESPPAPGSGGFGNDASDAGDSGQTDAGGDQ